jgi:RNA polymerase sigma-70 factor (ECF subfamily)
MLDAELDWTQIAAELGPRLFRYFAASRERAWASDLVQETLLRLFQRHAAGGFDPTKGSLTMFAFGIAHRARLEARRTERRPALESGVLATVEPDPILDERRALRRAIAALPDEQRDVVELLVDRDLTLAEIASILELPLNTVKSHVHRAKAALRVALCA